MFLPLSIDMFFDKMGERKIMELFLKVCRASCEHRGHRDLLCFILRVSSLCSAQCFANLVTVARFGHILNPFSDFN